MHLARDYIHLTPNGGRCRVRIFEPDDSERDSFMVILTEPKDNPGVSVTDAAEHIAGHVAVTNALPTDRTVFIEHHEEGARGTPEDRATFDLLTFSNDETVLREGAWEIELGELSWEALDRATVEALLERGVE